MNHIFSDEQTNR